MSYKTSTKKVKNAFEVAGDMKRTFAVLSVTHKLMNKQKKVLFT